MDDVTIEHAARAIQHAIYTGTVYDDAEERHQAITRHPAGKRRPPAAPARNPNFPQRLS